MQERPQGQPFWQPLLLMVAAGRDVGAEVPVAAWRDSMPRVSQRGRVGWAAAEMAQTSADAKQ